MRVYTRLNPLSLLASLLLLLGGCSDDTETELSETTDTGQADTGQSDMGTDPGSENGGTDTGAGDTGTTDTAEDQGTPGNAFRIVVISDPHVTGNNLKGWNSSLETVVTAINGTADIDFVLILGDLALSLEDDYGAYGVEPAPWAEGLAEAKILPNVFGSDNCAD